LDQGRVGPPGELAQAGVVDPGPEVVGGPDHRRPGRSPHPRLHLPLDRGQRPLDDLHGHRVGAGHDASPSTGAPPRGSPDPSRPTGAPPRGSPDPSGRVTIRFPNRSTTARNPGASGTVAPYSSTTAGPSATAPGPRSPRR